MRNQGWPRLLCRWVESFLSRRRIHVRHQDGISRDKVVECGVRHGLPLSPLLIPLHISILVKYGSQINKLRYADDIATIGTPTTGNTAAETMENIQAEV